MPPSFSMFGPPTCDISRQASTRNNVLDLNYAQIRGSVDHLADAFQKFEMNTRKAGGRRQMGPESKHHELTIDYPCFELLPMGARFYIEPPAHMLHGELPRPNRFFLDSPNEEIKLRMETNIPVKMAIRPVHCGQNSHLVDWVDRLQSCPGHSTLSFVTYMTEHGQKCIIFRLMIDWEIYHGLAPNENLTFNMAIEEWRTVESLKAQSVWVKLVQSHLDRATDMHFLDVQKKLENSSSLFAEHEKAVAEKFFNQRPYYDLHLMLMQRLQKIQCTGEGHYVFRYPCGHHEILSEGALMTQLSHDDCKNFECRMCGEAVLEKIPIALYEEHQRRKHFVMAEQYWDRLHRAFDANKSFAVTCVEFSRALAYALDSLQVPLTAMPLELNFANYNETTRILSYLQNCLAESPNRDMTVSGKATMGLLINLAAECLKEYTGLHHVEDIFECLPVGYRVFLGRFFSRTLYRVYALLQRREAQALKEFEKMMLKDKEKPRKPVHPDQLVFNAKLDKRRRQSGLPRSTSAFQLGHGMNWIEEF